jgi:5-methylcytosine-specific restriction protein A
MIFLHAFCSSDVFFMGNELNNILLLAQNKNIPFVDVKSGDLHRRVGGYPSYDHRMPICCSVMKNIMKSGDIILHKPPSGQGASLIIRYKLPRA